MSPSSCSVCHRTNTELDTFQGVAFCKNAPERVGTCEAIARHRAVRASAVKHKATTDVVDLEEVDPYGE